MDPEQPVPAVPTQVAVVGAGRMGSGIAHAFLLAGSRVQLHDVDTGATERGRQATETSVRRAAEHGLVTDVDEVLDRLEARVGVVGFDRVDLAIEAVPELPELKRSVLTAISDNAPSSAVIATNTSSISVSALARGVTTPSHFVGMHFFNPVPSSQLVELVRGDLTGESTIDSARAWVAALGKESIVVRDSPGFATSRLGLVIGLEAIRMLEEGVASPDDIDRGMVLGYRFPMGPLRLTDVVGLDVRLGIAEYLESQLGPSFTPPALLRELVARGDLGRKSGRGFFDWTVH